jgi:PAS domain S-box-containing protein
MAAMGAAAWKPAMAQRFDIPRLLFEIVATCAAIGAVALLLVPAAAPEAHGGFKIALQAVSFAALAGPIVLWRGLIAWRNRRTGAVLDGSGDTGSAGWFAGFMCIAIGLGIVTAVHNAVTARRAGFISAFRDQERNQTQIVRHHLTDMFQEVYEQLRTVARLPGVQNIDRHARGFNADAKTTVQELYNNLAQQTPISELYIVPLDLDPDAIDPDTGKNQEPITAFDQLIVGRIGGTAVPEESTGPRSQAPGVEEVEIFEYRVMKEQLAYFKRSFPHESDIHNLVYPALCGPQVITCDNSRYDPARPNDEDRSGLVYSVPFYGPNGAIKGCISAVMLTARLQETVADPDRALVHIAGAFAAPGRTPGSPQGMAARRSTEMRAAAPCDDLLYSESLDTEIRDASGRWQIWAAADDQEYLNSEAARTLARDELIGYAAGAGVTLLLGALARSIIGARARAESLARSMTAGLVAATAAAEEALRRGEVLRRALDTHTIVSVADASGRLIEVNDTFCVISGYSRTELLGQDHRILNSGEHPKSFWVQAWKTFAAGETWSGEVCNRAKDGSLYWVESVITPYKGANGKIEKYVSIRHDITARKLAEQRTAESEERTRLVIDTALDAVIAMDHTGVVTQWNTQAARTFGWSADEAIGQPLHELIIPKALRAAHLAGLARYVAGGEARIGNRRVEVPALRKDGTEITVELTITPVRSGSGSSAKVWFSAFLRDITEKKRSKSRLAESESRFRTLADSAPMLVWTGGNDAMCDYFNKPWLDFTGRTLDQEVGEGWTQSVHPDDRLWCIASYARAFEERRPLEVEFRLRRHDGVYRRILARGAPRISPNGTFDGFVGACADVTELHESQIRAEAASRTKSEFLANMSHEIRTPLTAILGFADLLLEDGDIAAAPRHRVEALDTIRRTGAHLLTIINDILDLSKIEANRMTVEHIDTPLVGILREVESFLTPRARDKGVSLTATLASPVPDRIMSDPTRLRQILMNLVGNAVKFTEQGGITITAGVQRRGDADGPSRLVIDVEDTGPGMTHAQAACLFQPFGQADGTVTRKHGGTGLGLTICRRLADMMGGTVVIHRTEPGKGSCFRLKLPFDPAPGTPMVSRLEAVRDGNTTKAEPAATKLAGRILLAEDGADNQRLLTFHLRKAGATVDIAENGRVALEMIGKAQAAGTPYDLLLTDMQMPEMDGYTLARTLRTRGNSIPIVALTSHAMAEDRAKCTEAGCNDYATKPIDKAQLLATCAAWMGRSSGRIRPSVAA